MYFLGNLPRLVGPLLVPSRFPEIVAQSVGGLRTHTLRLAERQEEGKGTTTFRFEPERPLAWQAGQHLLYTLPHERPDKKGTRRFFTIASPPHERQVQVTTRTAEPRSSFKQALLALGPGDPVSVRGPFGIFTVRDPGRPYVFIAGGVGSTPIHSILLDLDHRRLSIDATLFYANSTPDFVFKPELDAVAKRHEGFGIDYVVSPRRVSADDLKAAPQFDRDPLFYITGSPGLVGHYYGLLRRMGITRRRIRRDVLVGY
ncbi:MAG TPA: FAD-dependent oxidoreductase [Patescibacteria group bacterium]|jgi:ferredoxin-NADP reductase